MKAKIFLSSILCFLAIAVFAQSSEKIAELQKRISDIEDMPLKPDWIDFQLPDQDKFFFKRIAIQANEVKGKMEADMLAQQRAFQAGADYLGYHVNVASLNASIKGNTDEIYVDGQAEKKISVSLVCEYQEVDKRGSSKIITYWYLYEISKSGRIIANFDTDFDCSSREKTKARRDAIVADINSQIAKIQEEEQAKIRKRNGAALAASVFVPGAGQMVKHHFVEGGITLGAEVALLGAGAGTFLAAKKQKNIMNSYGIDYDTYQTASKSKTVFEGVAYTCFGLAAVVYGVNLWRAYTLKPKDYNYAFYPTLIQTDNAEFALGVGATIKF